MVNTFTRTRRSAKPFVRRGRLLPKRSHSIVAVIVLIFRVGEATALQPLTPHLVRDAVPHLDDLMSSGEAGELRFALAGALGLRPQSGENKGGWNYQQTVWVKTTTTALSDSCSTVRLEGHFRYGWQHHILLDGTFCLENAGVAWWAARTWKIEYPPGLPPGYADITTDGTFFPCDRPSGVDSVYQGGELPAVLRDKFAGVAAMPRLYFGSTGFDFIWHSGKRWVLLYLQGTPARGSLQVFDVSDDGQLATTVSVTPGKNGALCTQAQKYAHS